MKKILSTVAVSTALVMGGAVVASAAGIELDASFRTRGVSEQKTTQNSAPINAYDQRIRLGVKSKVSDELTGYFLLESGDGNGDTYTWGNETMATLQRGGTQAGASNKLGIIQAYVAYQPGVWGLKVGHMPIAPGTKQFVNHENSGDDAIVVTFDPDKATHFHVATIKLAENATNENSDDLDAYALVATRTFSDNFKAGLNYVYLKGAAEDDAAVVAGTAVVNGMRMSNLGLDATFKTGDLTLKGDLNYQFGTVMETTVANSAVDADGYAFQLSADYKLGNSVIGALFGLGSGVDAHDATSNVGDAFINFLGDSAYQVYIPGYRLTVPGSANFAGAGSNTGLSNLTLYQLNASTSLNCPLTGKPLSLRGALSYMQTTEDVAVGTGFEDTIGTEIDVVASWKLTNNLTYMVEAAYLFTGDAYKTSATSDPENAYFLRHGLTMKF